MKYFSLFYQGSYIVQFKYKCAKQTTTCSMFTFQQLKLCNSYLDERLKMFKMKLKSNLQVAAINQNVNIIK